ncbi:MAG TPA: MFS transporter [Chitinophagaceae bacterium]|nr:MFS transporter [Chitinophagaceae bacterium]
MDEQKLSMRMQVVYGFGMMGWSILTNLIAVLLVYFYAPPAGSGLPYFVTQGIILGIFNAIALITSAGRLFDAVTDPLIAQFSDRSKNPRGRRIPFMRAALLPSLVFCFLVFYPLTHQQSAVNIFWVMAMLICFYVSTTTYVIPFNALLTDLAQTPAQKVRLSSWQSGGFVFGIGISANALNIADWIHNNFSNVSVTASLQYTVAILAFVAAVAMAITAFGIDERKFAQSKPVEVALRKAVKQALGNRNFRFFIVADFTYFIAVTLISTGLVYFITVLLQLPKTLGNALMGTMVAVSFIFYPVVNHLAPRMGKKNIVIISFLVLAVVFGGVFFLGHLPFGPRTQIFTLVCIAAIPVASLNILPIAILGDIIEKDRHDTGTNKEALYFAVRYFFVKVSQTLGIALFSMMLNYGKDIGNDLGVRLSGVVGFVLCTAAAIIFTRFNDIVPGKNDLPVIK